MGMLGLSTMHLNWLSAAAGVLGQSTTVPFLQAVHSILHMLCMPSSLFMSAVHVPADAPSADAFDMLRMLAIMLACFPSIAFAVQLDLMAF